MTNLKDKMDEGGVIMPALNNMVTKASQIKGLRVVRMAAVKAYKAMREEEKAHPSPIPSDESFSWERWR